MDESICLFRGAGHGKVRRSLQGSMWLQYRWGGSLVGPTGMGGAVRREM